MTEDVTPRFGFPYLYAGQAQKEVFHNEALILADLLVQAYAKSADQMVPPQTPAPGECWIVGDAPSGDWAGWAGALACWTHGGWRSYRNGRACRSDARRGGKECVSTCRSRWAP